MMNWKHFYTFLWLRWRLTLNHARRQSGFARWLSVLVPVVLGLLGLGGGVAGFLLVQRFSDEDYLLLFAWNLLLLIFLFFWVLGTLAEVQREESIDLGKCMHLPVRLEEVFFFNYLISWPSPALIVLLPTFLGVALGGWMAQGGWLWLQFPLIFGVLGVVTSWTYYFKGWLATLMANPRLRRTLMVGITFAIILASQLPNLLVQANLKSTIRTSRMEMPPTLEQRQNLFSQSSRWSQLHGEFLRIGKDVRSEELLERFTRILLWVDGVSVVGWLPMGIAGLKEGSVRSALFGLVGCGLLTGLALGRGYRSTLRFYRGEIRTGGGSKRVRVTGKVTGNWVERGLLGFSPKVAAMAWANLRSLSRAAEVKMILLSPLILIVVFGSMQMSGRGFMGDLDQHAYFLPSAVACISIFGIMPLSWNMFGFDREGYRAILLAPISGRSILLGKNLSFLIVGLVIYGTMAAALRWVYPLGLRSVAMGLVHCTMLWMATCFVGNIVSVMVPYRVAPGSLKASRMPAGKILLSVAFSLLFPFVLLPVVIPVALEALHRKFPIYPRIPVNELVSMIFLVLMGVGYWVGLIFQGRLLEQRSQVILTSVVQKND